MTSGANWHSKLVTAGEQTSRGSDSRWTDLAVPCSRKYTPARFATDEVAVRSWGWV